MSAPKPAAWSEISGGRAALEVAHAAIADDAASRQLRLGRRLDVIGMPGAVSWNPQLAEIVLRGRTFRAQLLGSFDGASWLWSWANSHLGLDEERTAFARGLRDAAARLGLDALATEMIADDDEGLPAMLGDLAIAHGFGEAYWIANASQVYLFEPGQLEPEDGPVPTPVRIAVCFSKRPRTLDDALAALRINDELAAAPIVRVNDDLATIQSEGYAVRLVRLDAFFLVNAEIRSLPSGQDDVRGAATVFVVQSALGPSYAETSYSPAMGVWSTGPGGPETIRISWQALAVCEQLNTLEDVLLFDLPLRSFYPRT